eukprot:1070306-Alexandrium_andersonii.AAC.1
MLRDNAQEGGMRSAGRLDPGGKARADLDVALQRNERALFFDVLPAGIRAHQALRREPLQSEGCR